MEKNTYGCKNEFRLGHRMSFGTCNGYCVKKSFKELYVATKKEYKKGYYVQGCGRCSSCEIFLIPGIIGCPCCKRTIKNRPRETKDRRKYIESIITRY